MKYSNKNGGFAMGLIVLAIAAASVLGIIAVEKKLLPVEEVKETQDNVVGSGGRVQTAATGITSLTPWTSAIDAAGYALSGAGQIGGTNFAMTGAYATSTAAGSVVFGGTEFDQTIAGTLIPSIITTHAEGATQGDISMHHHTDTATRGSTFYGTRSRGTEASESVVQADDNLLDIVVSGHDGTDYANAARLDFEVDGTPGSNDMPGRIIMKTTPDGSGTPVDRVTIKNDGKVGIATSTPTQMLSVAGTVLANNYQATSTTEVSSFVGVKAGTKVNTDGATITVDWLQGPTQEVVLGATGRTLAFSNVQPGAALKLWVWQDGTGSRTITTYPTGTHWAGGTAPTLTATANKFDILVFTTASSTTQFSGGASVNY